MEIKLEVVQQIRAVGVKLGSPRLILIQIVLIEIKL